VTIHVPRPAVLDQVPPTGHVVIEASAGTGKTFTIEHLVVDLLLGGCPLEELLVVTFTEKAAQELRQRVRGILVRILAAKPGPKPDGPCWTVGDQERRRLEAALVAFPRAAIHTIHAFSRQALVEHAFPAGQVFAPALLTPGAATSEAFGRALRRDFGGPTRPLRPELEAWLDHGDAQALRGLLVSVEKERADLRPALARAELEARADELAALAGPGPAHGALCAAVDRSRLGTRKRAVLSRLAGMVDVLGAWRERRALLGLARLHDVGAGYLISDDVAEAIREKCPPLVPTVEAVRRLLRALLSVPALAAHLFLPTVRIESRRAKRHRGQLDYDDMIGRLRDALDPTAPGAGLLTSALRGRFRHALVDEFQDTDGAQWETFRRLFVDGADGRRLFVIGDPKQAIYGFRGADVFAYLDARDTLLGSATPVRLAECFRSTGAMIDAWNHLFRQDAPRPFFATNGAVQYQPVKLGPRESPRIAWRTATGGHAAPVHVFHATAAEGQRIYVTALRAELAARIAAELRDLVAGRTLWVGTADAPRPLEWSDVFVLTSNRWEALELGRHLRAAGVPYALYKQDGLFQTPEALAVADLLEAIADPHDAARRRRAWSGPFFGLSLAELERCHDLPGDHPLLQRLLGWSRHSGRHSVASLLERVVADSGVLRRELLLVEHERSLTNVLHLCDLLAERAARTGATLGELASFLRARAASGEREEEDEDVQRLETEAHAVQLLTMHKSKGLEAEVVVLFGGYSDPKAREVTPYHEPQNDEDQDEVQAPPVVVYHDAQRRRVVHVGPIEPGSDVARLVAAERADELARVAYVATTRARARLYVTSFGKHPVTDDDGAPVLGADRQPVLAWDFPDLGGVHGALAERLHAIVTGADPGPGFEIERLAFEPPEQPAPAAVRAACEAWRPPSVEALGLPAPPDPAAFAALKTAHAGRVLTSYSRMARDGGAALAATPAGGGEGDAAEDESPPLVVDLVVEADALRGGREVGSFLHRVIELAPLSSALESETAEAWAERPEVQEAVRRAQWRYPIDVRALPAARRLLFQALRSPVTLGATTLARGVAGAPDGHKELEFAYPIPEAAHAGQLVPDADRPFEVDRGWIRGVMDWVVVLDGKAWVVDWKSDTLSRYDQASLAACVVERYDVQRRLYGLALAKLLQPRGPDDIAARLGGVAYAFLRGMKDGAGVWFARPTWDELLADEARLRAALAAEVGA
jgi:exodeoxyribonuclease V beta subunit